MKTPLKSHFLTLAISILVAGSAMAASVTWNDAGTDFNTGANWTGGLPSTGDNATFSGPFGVNQPDLSATAALGSNASG